MKISNIKDMQSQAVTQYQRTENVKPDSEKTAGGTAGAPAERVDLSTTAKDVQQIRKALADLSDVRNEKVQDLKRRIDEGSYSVSGEKIAEKMVKDSLLDIFA